MPDIIQLLPDSVANQIAAGEVIQRPASVVKELVENSIDAGSSKIKIIVKDAGRTLIQIVDDGTGMSETDARLGFERHATSKIRKAEDLFSILTMGFRGEALASIAGIAHVELRTKRMEDELGTCIIISGSTIESQEACSCPNGSNFIVKNLFFNVPARRKFLKSNATELRHIMEEVQRVAFANPQVAFHLIHNDEEIYNLPISNLKQRIVNIIGRNRNQNLIDLDTDTSIAKVEGYIGKPEFAKKTTGEQYFFVNNRYMKHPFFYKAVMKAYDKILAPETYPSFFIYLSVDPASVDINIHPTKTEIKFENETAIWQILQASVKESLGKFNIIPSMHFDIETEFQVPVLSRSTTIRAPGIELSHNFNPFEEEKNYSQGTYRQQTALDKSNLDNWQKLYEGFENTGHDLGPLDVQQTITIGSEEQAVKGNDPGKGFFQFKNRYILTPVKSGLMIIDQKRAHERILYERFLITLENRMGIAQKTLFPVTLELTPQDMEIFVELNDDLRLLGFDISNLGGNTIAINGTPSDMTGVNAQEIIENFLERYKTNGGDIKTENNHLLAGSMAKASSVNYGKKLSDEEMHELVDELFACSAPNFTSDGKTVISILMNDEFDKRF